MIKYKKIIIGVIITGAFILGAIFQKYFEPSTIIKLTAIDIGLLEIHKPEPIEYTPSSVPKEYQGKLSLYVLVGQSNMSSRGDLRTLPRRTNKRIFVFGNDYHWHIAQEPIDNPKDQVDRVSLDEGAGYGPAYCFAENLLIKKPKIIIGLIPCAKGGSSIYQWQRCLSENSLYGSCLKRIYAASTMGKICGVLFFQGESDALDPRLHGEINPMPYEWGSQFQKFINNLRIDLSMPNLPFVFAQIGRNNDPKKFVYWNEVKRQQQLVNIAYCKMIRTDDLALQDEVHFTVRSYDVIGQRFAKAIISIKKPG